MILRRLTSGDLASRSLRLLRTSAGGGRCLEEPPYADVPRKGRRWERKPYKTPVKVLIRRAKAEKKERQENPCRILQDPPDNGLVVPELVPVAVRVFSAWRNFLRGFSRVLSNPCFHGSVLRCRFCEEIHIGHSNGHEIRSCEGQGSAARGGAHAWMHGGIRDLAPFPYCFHLFDRAVKPRIVHKERHLVPRLPAVVELCIQAGLNLPEFPARRRTKPVCYIDGRIVDFITEAQPPVQFQIEEEDDEHDEELEVREMAQRTMENWMEMRDGIEKLMERFPVQTCGYCEEVQVGKKGHKVRNCRATGHQFRAGMHAWQEGTVDDLTGTRYVWHIPELACELLANELKRFYGKAPAAVELCIQAGAMPPRQFSSMMRLDVALPALDERDLVA